MSTCDEEVMMLKEQHMKNYPNHFNNKTCREFQWKHWRALHQNITVTDRMKEEGGVYNKGAKIKT